MAASRLSLFALLAFALACGAWLLSLDPHERFTTDIAELLPEDERDPLAQVALTLVRERQARVVLALLSAPSDTAPETLARAATRYAATLRASPAFAQAEPLAEASSSRTLGQLLHARRFDLLLPGWFAEQGREHAASGRETPFPEWLAEKTVAELDARLAAPDGAAAAELLTSDPPLLLSRLAERAEDFAAAPAPPPGTALVWAETRAGPFSEQGQAPVFAALESALAAARAEAPGLSARHTGLHRFAAAAKESSRSEIARLNLLALIAVAGLSALLMRRPGHLLHLLPVVLLSSAGAITASTLLFPRVHVIVLVLGSLLCGVVVDYAFHLMLARREGEALAARLRRILPPLLGGAGTTLAGFLALTASHLPLVRQLGVYVAAGIICGLGAALLWLMLWPRLDFAPRTPRLSLTVPRSARAPLLAALVAVAVVGLWRVEWSDDLRRLEFPASAALREDDVAVRAAFGQGSQAHNYATRGDDFADARENWARLRETVPPEVKLQGLAPLLPRPAEYAAANTPEARDQLARFADAFAARAETAGFEVAAMRPFFDALRAHLAAAPQDYERLTREVLASIQGPLGLLAHADRDGVWFFTRATEAITPSDASATVSLATLQSLNRLFDRHRAEAARLALVGLAVLVALGCLMHGPRRGLRTAALPLLAVASAAGLLALRGEPFGLFHVLGLLLGACLADDYAHFAHADDGSPAARASIRLSAVTTAASFGTLALSSIPAVAALGLLVALTALLALLIVETNLLGLRSHD